MSSSSSFLLHNQTRLLVCSRSGVAFFNTSRKPREFLVCRPLERFNLVKTQVKSSSLTDVHRCRSSLESLFCYDKSIPEEIIEKPDGLSLNKREIGDNSACSNCQAKGAILCVTCSGSGLYVDSIMESQGIIVKVRCLGCGGSGNLMCSACGGRGHTGLY